MNKMKMNKRGMNKKGMFFTLIAIAFIVIFIFAFTFKVSSKLTNQMQIVDSRIISINEFVSDLERDTERGLYISSYRALLSIEEYIINQGDFVDNVKIAFEELLINGTVNGTTPSLMESSSFTQWTEQVSVEGDNFNLITNISLGDITIKQNDPWKIVVSAEVQYYIEDMAESSRWNYSKIINTSIPIIGFEDPIYVVNSLGRLTNTIQESPYSNNYTYQVLGEWNVDNLINHINYSYYEVNELAPSFLMRLENNLSSSPYGIESMVNLKKVSDFGLPIDTDASIIDYLYWNGNNDGDYRINNTADWVRLDFAHLENYNLTEVSHLD